MSEESRYRDKRSEFFQRFFLSGLPYEEYLQSANQSHSARWGRYEESIGLSSGQTGLLTSFRRKMNVLVMSGIWCGDCARQGPMLRAIEKACPVMEIRFQDNRSNPELQEELRMNGAEKVPIVVTLSEDFYEVGRFGDRHLSVYRRKAESQLGSACDAGIVPPPEDEISREIQEWVDYFERIQLMLRLAPALRKRYGD